MSQTWKRSSVVTLDRNDIPKTWQLEGFDPVPFHKTELNIEYGAYLDLPNGDVVTFVYNHFDKPGKMYLSRVWTLRRQRIVDEHHPTTKTVTIVKAKGLTIAELRARAAERKAQENLLAASAEGEISIIGKK